MDDEITVTIARVVGVHFQLTADQAFKLSRALAVAAENAANFLHQPRRRGDRFSLREQVGAGRFKLHIGTALVQQSQPRATARSRAALYPQDRAGNGQLTFSMWIWPSCTASTLLAISRSWRAATSGSASGRSALNFMSPPVLDVEDDATLG